RGACTHDREVLPQLQSTKCVRTASLPCTDGPSGERKFDIIITASQQTICFLGYFTVDRRRVDSLDCLDVSFGRKYIGLSHDRRPINGAVLELVHLLADDGLYGSYSPL